LQHLVRRFLSRRVDAFLAWGVPASEYVESLGVERQRLYRCHQVVDNEFWMSRAATLDRARERSDLGFDRKIFLFVGQLIPRKGVVNLLRAWDRMLPEAKSAARLVIVGEGELAPMLRELATSRAIDATFAGRLPPTELIRYYVAADAFVFPSLEDVWGMVVNEALCCGLPVLASRFAGASQELVAGRNVGEIFDPLDIETFAARLAEWALRPPAISAAACHDVIAPLNATQSSAAIAQMLQTLLNIDPRLSPG
jgi:glycosyltransferase involved in cell wall biosynthesis